MLIFSAATLLFYAKVLNLGVRFVLLGKTMFPKYIHKLSFTINRLQIMEKINPTILVSREMQKRYITAAAVARKLNLNPSSVKTMLHSDTMQVQRLLDMSNLLQYNFFREIAALLHFTEPVIEKETPDVDPTIALNERIKELEIEVKILRQTLKEVVGKE